MTSGPIHAKFRHLKVLAHSTAATVLTFAVIASIALIPLQFDFLDPLGAAFRDFDITDLVVSKLERPEDRQADTNIVLINIGNADREGVARIVEKVAASRPRIIGLDAFFLAPRDKHKDSLLRVALAKAPTVLVSSLKSPSKKGSGFDSLERSAPMFLEHATVGFANAMINRTEGFMTVRRFKPFARVGGDTVTSFAAEIVRQVDSGAYQALKARQSEHEPIHYLGNYNKFFAFDALDILDSSADLSVVTGKVVLLGYIGESLGQPGLTDAFFTPLNQHYAGKTLPDMYGVVIHANIISMLIRRAFVNEMPQWLVVVLAFGIGLLCMLVLDWLKSLHTVLFQALSVIFQLIFGLFILIGTCVVFDVFSYKADATLSLAVVALSTGMYEIYYETLVPLASKKRHIASNSSPNQP